MKTRQEYKDAALAKLSGFWGPAVLASFIYYLLNSSSMLAGKEVSGITSSSLFTILIAWPVAIGYFNAFKEFQNGEGSDIVSKMFKIGFNNYIHQVVTEFLKHIFIILWILLLIVPGIIMAIAYSMTEYIMVDRPDLSPMEAIRESKRLMNGHKMEFFIFWLSFIGWALLACCTFGIGLLWLMPYYASAKAHFYKDLVAQNNSL